MKKTKIQTEVLQQVTYAPPTIEITDITLEQNVLGSGSSTYESEGLDDFEGEDW